MDDDLAPPPADILTVMRSRTGYGWMIAFDGEPQAYFSTAADLCSYLSTVLKPIDIEAGVIPRDEPKTASGEDALPAMFKAANQMISPKPARLWRVFAGGRS